MFSQRTIALVCLAMLFRTIGNAQQGRYFPPTGNGDGLRYPLVFAPVVWDVGGPVAVAPGSDGQVHLAYTLKFTNVYGAGVKLSSLEVVDPFANYKVIGVNKVVAADNTDITQLVNLTPTPPSIDGKAYTNELGPGATGTMFLDVKFPDINSVPAYVSHRLTLTQPDANGQEQTYVVTDPPTGVDRRLPIVVSPPLHGSRWIDGDSCCEQIGGHRWARNPVNGRALTGEGFAADLIQLRKDGRVYSGPVNQLSSYAYYGANVSAAAPGKVVEVVRDMPDEVPGATPTNITVATAAGNHVIVQMAGKRYAMYAHLVPNSVTVQVGDSVETGQPLGKLGNSGSTSAPHLHFQVMDAPSPLDAHGLPFVFDHFGRRFVYSGSLNDEGGQTISGEPLTLVLAPNPGQLQDVMPLTFDLLDF
jgi:murein DD-endopeptidase MepM/ murein hydrolase activator NlpD